MPAIVGAIKVVSVSNSSVFHVGDVYSILPQSSAKTYAGGGSFNTGNGIRIHLGNSNTHVNDRDHIDQPKVL
ncbi:spore germination protein [Oceanobacillus caeni]|uniref:Spore gernimation protein GerPA n=1 Tax=Oceanobacillus caeni TaxID=405946 RepID=A0ABR5MNL8_9BACI|nr:MULTISPECIES: spore germination protein [Bacillaceae]KKE78025.1 spore gernimation protein GerPA [Bacilli bacterium VT-13-104]PZD84521.1 spore germination protein [Bacilli bacterium]KPH79178.1 spore gernimation protein GerPA [Oceanobacillus caeni]MBU8790346.1 spore germination protein [Oceanobacillus caeni]MCR1834653.1 spore germination protein [Oceanobacillus caeni]